MPIDPVPYQPRYAKRKPKTYTTYVKKEPRTDADHAALAAAEAKRERRRERNLKNAKRGA